MDYAATLPLSSFSSFADAAMRRHAAAVMAFRAFRHGFADAAASSPLAVASRRTPFCHV